MNQSIRGCLGIENKFYDADLSGKTLHDEWNANALCDPGDMPLNTVAIGDGVSERDGRQYSINKIHVRGTLLVEVAEELTEPPLDYKVKIALVLDTQTNGSQMQPGDVYHSDGITENGKDINGMRELEFVKRFRVLKEQTIIMRSSLTATNYISTGGAVFYTRGGLKQMFEWNIDRTKNPICVNLNGTDGTIGTITDNSLHIIAIADEPNVVGLSYSSRIRFTG